MTYADYTASGRALEFIEDFVRGQVLPRHANTHTESSGTGLQTTRLREDARRLIRDAVGGTDDDVVIFRSSGVTAAVNKLVGTLELRLPAGLADRYRLLDRIPSGQRWCSSGRTSTTPTSCRGGSRSRTWWSSTRTPTAWPGCSGLWPGTPTGRCVSAASPLPPTSPAF
jgi:hypothetical protein